MSIKKILYFDLENTLINHWTDPTLCWIQQNKNILEEFKPDVFGIFSFALWCEENIQTFIHGGMKEKIESCYDIQIDLSEIVPVGSMIECYNRSGRLEDYPGSNNKLNYFEAWVEENSENHLSEYGLIILVDDTVEENNVFLGRTEQNVAYRNPTRLVKRI